MTKQEARGDEREALIAPFDALRNSGAGEQ